MIAWWHVLSDFVCVCVVLPKLRSTRDGYSILPTSTEARLTPGVEYKHLTLSVHYFSAWCKPGTPPTFQGYNFLSRSTSTRNIGPQSYLAKGLYRICTCCYHCWPSLFLLHICHQIQRYLMLIKDVKPPYLQVSRSFNAFELRGKHFKLMLYQKYLLTQENLFLSKISLLVNNE